MSLSVIAVGQMKPGPLSSLLETYVKRLHWPLRLSAVEAKGKLEGSVLKAKEAEAIRSKLPEKARIVALDERGKTLTSPEFAAYFQKHHDAGTEDLAFIIGGADGLDESLRAEADLVLAFGAMTWPHLLARIMLLEQIYRAQQILSGHPYHRV